MHNVFTVAICASVPSRAAIKGKVAWKGDAGQSVGGGATTVRHAFWKTRESNPRVSRCNVREKGERRAPHKILIVFYDRAGPIVMTITERAIFEPMTRRADVQPRTVPNHAYDENRAYVRTVRGANRYVFI